MTLAEVHITVHPRNSNGVGMVIWSLKSELEEVGSGDWDCVTDVNDPAEWDRAIGRITRDVNAALTGLIRKTIRGGADLATMLGDPDDEREDHGGELLPGDQQGEGG